MNFSNKKSPGAKGVPQQFKNSKVNAPQFKPEVAQLKNAMAQRVKQPVAPAVYRPQAKPAVAQAKMAGALQRKTQPSAPPVYRPQPVARVLQTKTSGEQSVSKLGRKPPAVYCPQPSRQPPVASAHSRVFPKVSQQQTTGGRVLEPKGAHSNPLPARPNNQKHLHDSLPTRNAASQQLSPRRPKVLQAKRADAVHPNRSSQMSQAVVIQMAAPNRYPAEFKMPETMKEGIRAKVAQDLDRQIRQRQRERRERNERHLSRISANDKLLTVSDFESLPKKGQINPYRLRLAQGGIEVDFREKDKGKIFDLVSALVKKPSLADVIPAVRIGIHDNVVWCFDTRRVVAAQMARQQNGNVYLRYEKISDKELTERTESILDIRKDMGLIVAIRPSGKHSSYESLMPHVNPAYYCLIRPEDLMKGGKERLLFNETYGKDDPDAKSEKKEKKVVKKEDDWETD